MSQDLKTSSIAVGTRKANGASAHRPAPARHRTRLIMMPYTTDISAAARLPATVDHQSNTGLPTYCMESATVRSTPDSSRGCTRSVITVKTARPARPRAAVGSGGKDLGPTAVGISRGCSLVVL